MSTPFHIGPGGPGFTIGVAEVDPGGRLPFAQDRAPDPHDALGRYYTPQKLADLVVDAIDFDAPGVVVDPSVGGGAFARAIRRRWASARLVGVDLDPEARGLALCDEAEVDDWLSASSNLVADVIVGNPDFGAAREHVLAALACRPAICAFILPLANLGVGEWASVFARYPLAVLRPIPGRPWPKNVRETAVFEWHRGHVGDFRGRPLGDWR